MDPVTVIVTALASGAAAAAQETATAAIKDAYQGLRALIQRKFAGQPAADLALTQHADKPEVWEAPLKEVLTDVAADRDDAIITAAQALLTLTNPPEAASGTYHLNIAGNAQGVVQGDHAQVTMTFGDRPEGR
jgi:hypothetical protein